MLVVRRTFALYTSREGNPQAKTSELLSNQLQFHEPSVLTWRGHFKATREVDVNNEDINQHAKMLIGRRQGVSYNCGADKLET